jgi:hypothetical protein
MPRESSLSGNYTTLKYMDSQMDRRRSIPSLLAPSPMRAKVCIIDHPDERDVEDAEDLEIEMDDDSLEEMELDDSSKNRKSDVSFIKSSNKRSSRVLSFVNEVNSSTPIEYSWFINDCLTPYGLFLLILSLRYWIFRDTMRSRLRMNLATWLIRTIYNVEELIDPPLSELVQELTLFEDKEYVNLAEYVIQEVSQRFSTLKKIFFFIMNSYLKSIN